MSRRVLLLIVLVHGLPVPSRAQQSSSQLETDVKATFVYQFSRYVDWPAKAFDGDKSPFKVCVLGDLVFRDSLDKVLEGESVGGRPMQRVIPDTPASARECHILYVEVNELPRVQSWLSAVRLSPVLTVSDDPDFLAKGGHIALVRDSNRIRFDVNLAAARQSGITLRSQLLRVARNIVRGSGNKP